MIDIRQHFSNPEMDARNNCLGGALRHKFITRVQMRGSLRNYFPEMPIQIAADYVEFYVIEKRESLLEEGTRNGERVFRLRRA